MVATCGGVFFGVARLGGADRRRRLARRVPRRSAMRRSRRSSPGIALPVAAVALRLSDLGGRLRASRLRRDPLPAPRRTSRRLRAGHREPLPLRAAAPVRKARRRRSLLGAALWLAPGRARRRLVRRRARRRPTGPTSSPPSRSTRSSRCRPTRPTRSPTTRTRLADDVDSMTPWWAGSGPDADPALRPGASSAARTCLDISFVRLPETGRVVRGHGREAALPADRATS